MPLQDDTDDQLYRDQHLVQFYDLENSWGPDQAYCLTLASEAQSVLDLGCGTGQFIAGLPDGLSTVGVDPATAMLDVARTRPGGHRTTWIEADARTIRLSQEFELVVLTGHAFQVFLKTADQQAVIDTIAAHLAPGGRFIFDSRNPLGEAWRTWVPEQSRRQIKHPELGLVDAWIDAYLAPDTGVVTYETHYQTDGQTGGREQH